MEMDFEPLSVLVLSESPQARLASHFLLSRDIGQSEHGQDNAQSRDPMASISKLKGLWRPGRPGLWVLQTR
jgi:hypothetical protein